MFVDKNSRKHYDFLPPRIELDLAIQGDGHQGATDEFATIPFHLVLFSAALVELTNSILVHSLILSSHLFLYLPLLFPFTFPCTIVLAKPEDFEMWPNPGFIRVREMSGKFKIFQGQGIVREFHNLSGKIEFLLKCQGILDVYSTSSQKKK